MLIIPGSQRILPIKTPWRSQIDLKTEINSYLLDIFTLFCIIQICIIHYSETLKKGNL